MIDRAKREIQIATVTATKELYDLSAKLATDMAARVIGRELSAQDHERLIAEAIDGISSTGPASARGRTRAMANVDERERGGRRLYAEAILHVAEEQGQAEAAARGAERSSSSYLDENPEFEQFLASPLVEEGAATRR